MLIAVLLVLSTDLSAGDSKLVARRPAVIESLEWHPHRGAVPDSVDTVDLSFYNNQLFRTVINYKRLRTEGMTTADRIEAIAAGCGDHTAPGGSIVLPSYNNESVPVLARTGKAASETRVAPEKSRVGNQEGFRP